jgi:geranylgeranyl pyrophosphate synthase
MDIDDVRKQVMSLPEVADWPAISAIFERQVARPHQVWEWPLRACRAVGGDESVVAPGSAAILCMILSILLVDDMLDQDPRGEHLKVGDAMAANLSFAFQSIAFRVIANTPVDAGRRAAVMDALAQMALTMAYGQDMDTRNLTGEENYWKVTHAKSSSYFGTAMHIGAILGKANPKTVEKLRQLGAITGDAIQIHDDIQDAMETPANPDWKQGRNNLLFLYALTADHPDREQFTTLRSQVDDPETLRSAQQILIKSGAVSYAMYHLCQSYLAAQKILKETPLADPDSLRSVIDQYIVPLVHLLKNLGIAVPAEIDIR